MIKIVKKRKRASRNSSYASNSGGSRAKGTDKNGVYRGKSPINDGEICETCPKGQEYDIFRESEFEFKYEIEKYNGKGYDKITRISDEKINLKKVKDPLLETIVFMAEASLGNYKGERISNYFTREGSSISGWGSHSLSFNTEDSSGEIAFPNWKGTALISHQIDKTNPKRYPGMRIPQAGEIHLRSMRQANTAYSEGATEFSILKVKFHYSDANNSQWIEALYKVHLQCK